MNIDFNDLLPEYLSNKDINNLSIILMELTIPIFFQANLLNFRLNIMWNFLKIYLFK